MGFKTQFLDTLPASFFEPSVTTKTPYIESFKRGDIAESTQGRVFSPSYAGITIKALSFAS